MALAQHFHLRQLMIEVKVAEQLPSASVTEQCRSLAAVMVPAFALALAESEHADAAAADFEIGAVPADFRDDIVEVMRA